MEPTKKMKQIMSSKIRKEANNQFFQNLQENKYLVSKYSTLQEKKNCQLPFTKRQQKPVPYNGKEAN